MPWYVWNFIVWITGGVIASLLWKLGYGSDARSVVTLITALVATCVAYSTSGTRTLSWKRLALLMVGFVAYEIVKFGLRWMMVS